MDHLTNNNLQFFLINYLIMVHFVTKMVKIVTLSEA